MSHLTSPTEASTPDGAVPATTTSTEANETSRFDRLKAWRPTSDVAIGTITACVVLAFLLIRNHWVLGSPIHFGGDEGIQFGTVRDAISFRELRGAGSRTGFHHPGQGYAYIWGLAELVYRTGLVPMAQHNFQMLATYVFVSAELGVIVAIVRSHLGTWLHGAVVLCGLAVFASAEPGMFGGPWLPYMYAGTFALLLVAGSSAVGGRLRSLPAFAIAAGFLVHGHIQFVSFVGVSVVLVLVGLWRTGGFGRLWGEERRSLYWTIVAIVAFATPILIYTIRDWPGELGKYLDFLRQRGSGSGLSDSIRYVLQYWPGGANGTRAAFLVIAFLALVTAAIWRRSRFAMFVAVGAAAMELCLLQYAVRGIDDLSFRYVGLFSYMVPGLVIGTAVALLIPAVLVLPARRALRFSIYALIASLALLPLTARSLAYAPANFTTAPDALEYLEQHAGGREIAINGVDVDQGTFFLAPAVASLAEEEGVEYCFVNKTWELKFGKWRLCTPKDLEDAEVFTLYSADDTNLPAEVKAANPPLFQTAFIYDGRAPLP